MGTWKGSTPTESEATSTDVSLRKQFGRRLVETATMYKNRTILRGSEAYTSKQCGACGTINDRLGSSITFVCSNCSSVADRDVHAARNVLLRFME
jgi:transposase